MSDSNLRALNPGPTDTEKATGYRNELAEPIAHICDIMNRAQAYGLKISFGINLNSFGRYIANVDIVKPL